MPSHAGRWNSNRMGQLLTILDGFNSILIAPIRKKDHIDINLMGIYETPSEEDIISTIIARTTIAEKDKKYNRKYLLPQLHGAFPVKSSDEDMIYAMAALMSAMGYSVYMPKIIEQPDNHSTFPGFVFAEFTSRPEYANSNISSTNIEDAANFCRTNRQPST